MLKNISIFVIFSFFSGSIGQWSNRKSPRHGSKPRYGGQRSRPSVWDKCSNQTITDGEIKCDINGGRGNYPIETAVCTATCRDGYLMIGMTFDSFFFISRHDQGFPCAQNLIRLDFNSHMR